MMHYLFETKRLVLYTSLFAVLLGCSCGANERVLNSGKSNAGQANAEPLKRSIEQDIESMRTAGFTYIFILRRKDGGLIDAENRAVLRLHTADANRRVASDDGRAFLVGSNFQISAKSMAALYARFAIEDNSPPVATVNTNENGSK